MENMKSTIYVPLNLLMLHAKFGEEWSSITLEEDEYVQLLMHDDDR